MLVNTSLFRFDRKHNTLIQEASSVGLPAGNWPPQLQVVSQRTGKTLEYHRTAYVKAKDGELIGVRYTAPGVGLAIFLYND
jgi:hypothetical protein